MHSDLQRKPKSMKVNSSAEVWKMTQDRSLILSRSVHELDLSIGLLITGIEYIVDDAIGRKLVVAAPKA